MRRAKDRARGGQPSPELMTPSHPPVRKVAGRRSRSPSPKRRPLSRGIAGLQLGNFEKLFAALNQPELIKSDAAAAADADTTAASSHGTTPTATSNAIFTAATAADSLAVELDDKLSSLNITPTPNKRNIHHIDHRRPSSDSSATAQAPVTPSRNLFSTLQNVNAHTGTPEALLTPPASDDEEVDTVFEQTKTSSPPSAATTPCSSLEQKSDSTPRLGSRLAALVGAAPQSVPSPPAATSIQLNLTPIPTKAVERRPAPSSENAQRLFDLYTSPATPTSSFSNFTQRVHSVFSTYDQRLGEENPSQLVDGTHIFIDWSNFFVGCRSTVRDLRNLGPRERLRFSLNFERVKFLLERKRDIRSRHLAGSRGTHKFANDQLDSIRLKGYDVMCPQRIPTALHRGWNSDYDSYTSDCSVSDSDHSRKAVWDTANSWGEQCVDELLQLKMAKEIIQSSTSKRTGVMVLATGDANDAEFSKGGFLGMVTNALESGWCVELHSFSSSISSAWRDPAFAARWGDRFTYHILDDFAELLVEQDV